MVECLKFTEYLQKQFTAKSAKLLLALTNYIFIKRIIKFLYGLSAEQNSGKTSGFLEPIFVWFPLGGSRNHHHYILQRHKAAL